MTNKELIHHRMTRQWITPVASHLHTPAANHPHPPAANHPHTPAASHPHPLAANHPHTPAEVVSYLGAVQAQDYAMSKWAVGMRCGNTVHDEVEQAIDQGLILRTHVLRPTWHLVHAEDIRWMLALSAPRIRAAGAGQIRSVELNDKIFRRSGKIIEKALAKDKHLTRTELMSRLGSAGIATNDIRAAYIMMWAEIDGLVCNGPRKGKQFTYALLEQRVPPVPTLSRDESLARLALRYFSSHGPATIHDFAWWAGLLLSDAKKGMETSGSHWHTIAIGEKKYWLVDPSSSSPATGMPATPSGKRPGSSAAAHLLPAFDELIVSYTDRSALFDAATERLVVTNNGLFRPSILVDGKVIGCWSRTERSGKITITQNLFQPVGKRAGQAIAAACKRYQAFMGKSAR